MALNRRNFLNSSLLVAGIPMLGSAANKTGMEPKTERITEPFYAANNITPKGHESYFISHRGVHLKQRIAGENTVESLRLAKRVGFQCMEFDVRFTRDQQAVVIHDETINRTLRDLKGNKLTSPVYVKDLTFAQLRTEYLVYTENEKAKVVVPTFEEYLNACNLYKMIPFVEIKDHELPKAQYDYLIGCLDTIIGRQNYIITSNNKVNAKLREMGYQDITVMGILYQTTFAHIQSWKNAIMAISASRFNADELHKQVLAANDAGILTESHADTMDKYNVIIRNGIDFISTDALMPEGSGSGQVIAQTDLDNGERGAHNERLGFSTNGRLADAQIWLQPGNHLEIDVKEYQHLFLYGLTLEIEFSGKCLYHLDNKEYTLQAASKEYFRYPLLLHKEAFTLKFNAIEACHITGLRLTITRF